MSSGVEVNSEVMVQINNVLKRKAGIALFCMSDTLKEIIVDKTFPDTYPDGADALVALKAVLPSEPRYVIVDFAVTNDDGHARDNLLFITWCPESSTTKQKMLYASSKQYIAKLASQAKNIQATDFDELDFKLLRNKCLKL